jgi:hypothetical protein
MPDPMAQLAKVKKRHEQRLLKLPNVIGLGIGLRQVKGQVTDSRCLVVFVTHKVPPGLLAENERIPVELDGFPVDVQEIGQVVPQS